MSILDLVRDALTSGLRARPLAGGAGEVVTLPFAFSSGNLVQIRVTRVEEDRWLVSDRGVVAGELATLGVDLEARQVAADSWQALVGNLRADPPVFRDVGTYEIAGESSTDDLGEAVVSVGETAVRAEMLRVLAPGYRARSFKETILSRAGEHDLPFTPNAPMPTKHGGRRSVTVRIEAPAPVYMQAVSGKTSTIDGFDKAQAVFSSANVEKERLVAVLASRVRLEAWQWETLRESGVPISEPNLDAFLESLRQPA